MSYAENKRRARTKTTTETLTDQSAAYETDRNVIVTRYMVHGQAPGALKQPMYGDFSQLPTDLRGFIEQARSIKRLRNKLPEQLRNIDTDALLRLTPDELKKILTPPATTPAPKTEEIK